MAIRSSQQPKITLGTDAQRPLATAAGVVEGQFYFATNTGVLSIVAAGAWTIVGASSIASGILSFSGTVAQATAAGLFLSNSSGVAGVATRPGYIMNTDRTVQNMKVNVTVGASAGTATTITVFKNGVATAMTVTTALNSGPVVLTSAGPVAFLAGDTLDVQAAGAADPGATRTVAVTIEYKG